MSKLKKEIIIQEIAKRAKDFFIGASGCHDWTHVERVRNLALRLGKLEAADLFVLEIAALLHDIGRKEEINAKGAFCHAEKGAEIAKDILEQYSLDANVQQNILHCIITHRFRNTYVPETIEAQVLFDSDKLDSIGAIGIARDFLFAGNAGSGNLYTGNEQEIAKQEGDFSFGTEDSAILEYEIKLRKVKDKILTKSGKRLAQARHDYMCDYFQRFWEEVDGLK